MLYNRNPELSEIIVSDTYANKSSKYNRILWIDAFKAIGINLVIIGHLPISGNFYNFIFIFHMYAFFFIAGVVSKYNKETKYKDVILKNIEQLYIPYITFALVWIIFNRLWHMFGLLYTGQLSSNLNDEIMYFGKALIAVLFGTDSVLGVHIGPAWFLIALFVVKTIYSFFQRVFNDNIILLGSIAVLLFLCGYILNNKNILPFSIVPAMTSFLFYFLGDLLKAHFSPFIKMKMKYKFLIFILCILTCISCSVWAGSTVLLIQNSLPENIFAVLIGAISGIVALITISVLCSEIYCFKKIYSFIGQNSLIIMGIHSPIRVIMLFVLSKINITMVQNFITWAFTLLLSIPVCIFLNRKLPVLVGKKKIGSKCQTIAFDVCNVKHSNTNLQ